MITVVGLGNPGDEYSGTRHNAGRLILEDIAKEHDFFDWKKDMKAKALTSSGKIGKAKFQFVLPNDYMNNSGKSVTPFIKSKKDLAQLVVVYDDLDIPLGRIKISFNRSSGGHNGVESIIKQLGTPEFLRVRVGVSPRTASGKTKKPSGEKAVLDFLMKNFKKEEKSELTKIAKRVCEALEYFSEEGKDKMMTEFNK